MKVDYLMKIYRRLHYLIKRSPQLKNYDNYKEFLE